MAQQPPPVRQVLEDWIDNDLTPFIRHWFDGNLTELRSMARHASHFLSAFLHVAKSVHPATDIISGMRQRGTGNAALDNLTKFGTDSMWLLTWCYTFHGPKGLAGRLGGPMTSEKAPPIRPGSGKAEYEYGKVAHRDGDPPGVSTHLGLSLPLFPKEDTDDEGTDDWE